VPVQEVDGLGDDVVPDGEASAVGAEGNPPGSRATWCRNRDGRADVANEGAGIEPHLAFKFSRCQPSVGREVGAVARPVILVIARDLSPIAVAGVDAQPLCPYHRGEKVTIRREGEAGDGVR